MNIGRYRFVMLALLVCVQAIAQSNVEVMDVMKKNFYASKPKRLQQEIEMVLVNSKSEERVRKIRMLLALQENGIDSNIMIRFLEPADIKGTGFLQHEHRDSDDDLWIFLPALHKSRRLVSSNKKDSFMGTDFSYGDMLLPKVSLYKHRLVGVEMLLGSKCYVIESVPADTDVKKDYGYGRKITWIEKNSYHEIRVEYFDTADRLLKVQTLERIEPLEEDRWLAMKREMVNHQTGHKTVVTVRNYTTDVEIDRRTFTVRNLEWY